ncbi:uncharacterized protein LOC128217182 [Mya arenaria]|uniref:uncharacterized protein LOC128217182 n=1 Tax=Mya arenaria TaxID=6604 RepID=UPI0022E2D9C0|nr:uncharacterized protein LOC128217182 [Mya arenaria]
MLESADSFLQADLLVQSALKGSKGIGTEASFDSGYSTSPANPVPGSSGAGDMNPKMTTVSPSKNPFRVNTDSNQTIISPMKSGFGAIFSPFKDSSLSPFKLLQSPSKGTFDEWEKDLFANLDENLFGMGDLSENIVDELLKSPQGKLLLESKNSPSHVVRRLRISPDNRHKGQKFQSLNSTDLFNIESVVKTELMDTNFTSLRVKDESTIHDHMYGQQTVIDISNSAIDRNKMSDTPMKPRFSSMENAPIRKLSMRAVGSTEVNVQHVVNAPANITPILHLPQTWPSKDKLKFARMQFKQVLNDAVERELAFKREKKRLKSKKVVKSIVEENRKQLGNRLKMQSGKCNKKGNIEKSKGKKVKAYKKKKKDTYPEIKMALTKTGVRHHPQVVHREPSPLPPRVQTYEDPGWYPSDDEDVVEPWNGPPPFYTQMSSGFYSDESSEAEESEEKEETERYSYETLSGRRVTLKRPRLY